MEVIMNKKTLIIALTSLILMVVCFGCSPTPSGPEGCLKKGIEALNEKDSVGIFKYFEVSGNANTYDLVRMAKEDWGLLPQKVSILKTKTRDTDATSWILTNTTFRNGNECKIEYMLKVVNEQGDWKILMWIDHDFVNERE